MGVVTLHPQRGLVHKLGFGAEQFVDVGGRVLVTLRVFQVDTLPGIIQNEQTLLESVVLGVREGVDVETVDSDDALGSVHHLAVRAGDANLLALGIIDRRFAHRESQRDDVAGLCLASDILADAEAMLGDIVHIHREHIAILARQHRLGLTRAKGTHNRQQVLLVGGRDARVCGDGSQFGRRRDASADGLPIVIRVDLHTTLVFRHSVERVLDGTGESVSLLGGLKRRQDISTLFVQRPVHTVALDELDTLVERDERIVKVYRSNTKRPFAACKRNDPVVELVEDRGADDLVVAVKEVSTERTIAGLNEPHTSLLELTNDVLGVITGKQTPSRVKEVLQTLLDIVAKSALAEQSLLYRSPITAVNGRSSTLTGRQAGAVADTPVQIHSGQDPSHRLTGRLNETRGVLALAVHIEPLASLKVALVLGGLLRRHIGHIGIKDGLSDFRYNSHLPTQSFGLIAPHHIDHIRHQSLYGRVRQQGVPAFRDSADVIDSVDVHIDILALRAVNDVESIGGAADSRTVRQGALLIRTHRCFDLGLALCLGEVAVNQQLLLVSHLQVGLKFGTSLKHTVKFDTVGIDSLDVLPLGTLGIYDLLLFCNLLVHTLQRLLHLVDASLVGIGVVSKGCDLIAGGTGFGQLSLTLLGVSLGFDLVTGVKSLSLGHNDSGFGLGAGRKDSSSLKLAGLDELHTATGGHMKVTDDASTLDLSLLIIPRLGKELKDVPALGRVFRLGYDCGDIAKHRAGVHRLRGLREKLVSTVCRTQNTREAHPHPNASAEGIGVVKGSDHPASSSGDNAVFPDDTACIAKSILKAAGVHSPEFRGIIDKHIGLIDHSLLGGCQRLARNTDYLSLEFGGLLLKVDSTTQERGLAVAAASGNILTNDLLDSGGLSSPGSELTKHFRTKELAYAYATDAHNSSTKNIAAGKVCSASKDAESCASSSNATFVKKEPRTTGDKAAAGVTLKRVVFLV